MAYVEVLTNNGLTVEQWENEIFAEWIGHLWWNNLMGTSSNAVIQVKDDLTKSAGDAVNFGLRGLMQGGKVTGNSKAAGNEGTVLFDNQRVVVDNVRHVIKIEDVPMTNQRTAFNVLTEAREALVEKAAKSLDDDITTGLSDTDTGRVRGRYLYGAADSNWNATHATALATIDNAADQLTSNMIDIAKRKALIPVNATSKMRPMRIVGGEIQTGMSFEDWFVFVGHTYAIRDLVNNDAAFRNAQLLLPPGSNADSIIRKGQSFKGSWNGTLVYEYDSIELADNTNSVQTAQNLLLGAQAQFIAWAQRSKFGEDDEDIGHDLLFELHEIRNGGTTGVDKAVFTGPTSGASTRADGNAAEDHGVVHVFSAAVGD
jgi:N4-gp56 family major capsid protein